MRIACYKRFLGDGEIKKAFNVGQLNFRGAFTLIEKTNVTPVYIGESFFQCLINLPTEKGIRPFVLNFMTVLIICLIYCQCFLYLFCCYFTSDFKLCYAWYLYSIPDKKFILFSCVLKPTAVFGVC